MSDVDLQTIAIVGMACRFPRSPDVESYWRNIAAGVDCITDLSEKELERAGVPEALRGDSRYVRAAGILENVEQFDAAFFGMTPSEARLTDPQQRILLECAQDAFENAGYDPKVSGSQTGVFGGVGISSYLLHHLGDVFLNAESITYLRMLIGNDKDYPATLISHKLNLKGPSINVNTACSTSLVALNLACNSLLLFNCDMALAACAKVIVPHGVGYRYQEGGLFTPTGHMRAFDRSGEGPIASSGAGAILLKRLEDALRDGDFIHAVIRGTALNNDGADKMSFTAPSELGQARVIADALAAGDVDPDTVTLLEAHGTGTPLGDPIEIAALSRVYRAKTQRKQYCAIGSVKTNIGHLDTAAGMAGIIKAVEALKHKQLPPTLHFEEPNPELDFANSPFFVNTELREWKTDRLPRRAGVSSFGFGGTNAHVVLEEAPARPAAQPEARAAELLTLSAADETALSALAERYRRVLQEEGAPALSDVCFTAATGRAHHPFRLSVAGAGHQELAEALATYAQGGRPQQVHSRRAAAPPRVGFLFTGQGAQYLGMGRELAQHAPVFKEALELCTKLFERHLDRPLLPLLWGDDSELLNETRYTQPAVFAVQHALCEQWSAWGIKPQVVLGHSIGEYAAACFAGVFSLEDAVMLVAARGRLMHELTGPGSLLAVTAPLEQVLPLLSRHGEHVAVAARNGPEQVVISGEPAAVSALAQELAAQGLTTRSLPGSRAFHSPLMRPMLERFEQLARKVRFQKPNVELISTVTGKSETSSIADASYWVRQVEATVRFEDAFLASRPERVDAYLEVGPGSSLLNLARECAPQVTFSAAASVRRGQPEYRQALSALGMLYTCGAAVRWEALYPEDRCRRVPLPTYPYQRKRFWLDEPSRRGAAASSKPVDGAGLHPLLGARCWVAGSAKALFERSQQELPTFLSDHRLFGNAFMPASGFLEMAFAAGARLLGTERLRLSNVEIPRALPLPDDGTHVLQLHLTPEQKGYQFTLYSAAVTEAAEPSWSEHCFGTLEALTVRAVPAEGLDELKRRINERVAPADVYGFFDSRGITFGPSFRGLQEVFCCGEEALGRVVLPEALLGEEKDYFAHPVLLDACLQVVGAAGLQREEGTFVSVGISTIELSKRLGTELFSHVLVRAGPGPGARSAEVTLYTAEGEPVGRLSGIDLRRVTPEAFASPGTDAATGRSYQLRWRPKPRHARGESAAYLPSPESLATQLADRPRGLADELGLSAYRSALAQVDALSIHHVVRALEALGVRFEVGSVFSASAVLASLAPSAQNRSVFLHFLEMLKARGILSQQGSERWEVAAAPAQVLPPVVETAPLEGSPAAAEFALVSRCGPALARVLRGEVDPLQLLFPDGDMSLLTRIYQDTANARLMNGLVQEVVSRALQALPSGRAVRILEIGAGTGATTSNLLPRLPADRTRYTFSDVSPLFVMRARETFSAFPWVEFRTLNIDEPFPLQGFEEGSFDLIVASNVLHASRAVGPMLERVGGLLAPQGTLVMREVVRPQDWGDITFGLTHGWWHFEDRDVRPAYPLLSPAQWQTQFRTHGFASSSVLMPDAESPEAVLIAQRPRKAHDLAPGRWLILADKGGVGQALARRLEARGAQVVSALPGASFAPAGERVFHIRPDSAEDLERLLRGAGPLDRIVHLGGLDAAGAGELQLPELVKAAHAGAASALSLFAALAHGGPRTARVWLVTRSAEAVSAGDAVTGLAQAPLWGVGKCLALEHPALWGGLVDLPDAPTDVALDALVSEFAFADGEDLVALRESGRYGARLERWSPQASELATQGPLFRADGTYLLTGGLGTLGLRTAGWMVAQGARHLALVGRREPGPEAVAALARLEKAGAKVHVLRADVGDEHQLRAALDPLRQGSPPLRGVIHTAGVAGGNHQGADVVALDQVLHPKVLGAWNLHRLTRDEPLDFFVCYSSMVSVWGSRDQAHYVAANQFLDALCHHRRAQGLPALSINWGPWAGTLDTLQLTRAAQAGVSPLQTEDALKALGVLLRTQGGQFAITDVDWTRFGELYAERGRKLMFEGLRNAGTPVRTESRAAVADDLLQQLERTAPAGRQGNLMKWLQREVARIAGLGKDELPEVRTGFFDMGLDSLLTLELRSHLAHELRMTVPARALFDHPTIEDLSRFLMAQHPLLKDSVKEAPVEPPTAMDSPEIPDSFKTEAEITALLAEEMDAWKDLAES